MNMKRLSIIIMAMLLLWSGIAVPANAAVKIDKAALEWYAQAATDLFYDNDIPVSMLADTENASCSLFIICHAEAERKATLEEALKSEWPPSDLIQYYDASTNTVLFAFSREYITDIPKSVEIYADGKQLIGEMLIAPDKIEKNTEYIGFEFSFDQIESILAADYVFLRLATDKNTCFIEFNEEIMPTEYFMLFFIYGGLQYAQPGSDHYLDKEWLGFGEDEEKEENSSQLPAGNMQQLTFQNDYEAIDRTAKSAFLLEVYDAQENLISTGSGFVAFDRSVMITNEHVIEDAAYIIAYSDQYKNSYKLTELTAVDAEADIAILKFDAAANVQPLKVDSNSRLLRGQPVTAIGSPKGVLNTVSSGNISNIVYHSDKIPDYIQFTAPISPGSSGGALFNDQGAVIGLCVSYLKEGQAMYYAIPIKYVEALYKSSQGKRTTSLREYNGLNLATLQLTNISNGIQVTWEAVPGATSYTISRKQAKKSEPYVKIGTVRTSTSFLDHYTLNNVEYEYQVTANTGSGSILSNSARITRRITETATPRPRTTPKPTITRKPTSTPKPTAASSITIKNFVSTSNGKYTINWSGEASAPYRISYSLSTGSGQTFRDSGIYSNSYTTSLMIPGKTYKVTVTDSKGKAFSQTVTVPIARNFSDGTLKASNIGILVSPRRDADGMSGPGGAIYEKNLIADEMTYNIRNKGWSYGLYYRIDLPSFSGKRTYRETVVFRAPNGYNYIWKSSNCDYTFPGSESWWKWDIMGEEFFQELMNKYKRIPTGKYYVDLYWNGMLVNSTQFQIN